VIEDFVFRDAGLHSIKIPDNVTSIGIYAFAGCTALESIELPTMLQKIGDSAFECTGLRRIKIPDNVTDIGNKLFRGCTNLKSVQIPKNIKDIDCIFDGCTSLEKYKVPLGVTQLRPYAFRDCKCLKEIVIPQSVTKIGETGNSNRFWGAFEGCSQLVDIEYPKRFSLNVFLGTPFYENLSNRICPKCKKKLSIFDRCKVCGKKYDL
jgi:hypothetical protein